jgi:hypothetical protein
MSFFKAFVSSVARGVDEEIKDRRDKLEDVAFEISENFDRAKIQAQKAVASAQIEDKKYSDTARFVLSKSDEGRKILELAGDSPEDLKIIGQNYLEDTRGVNPKQIDFKKYNKSLASKFLTGPVGEQKFRSLAKARKQPIAEMPEVPEFSQTAEIIAGMEKPSFEKLLSRVEDPKLRTAIQNIRGGMPATEQTKFQGLGIRPEEFVKVTEKEPDKFKADRLSKSFEGVIAGKFPTMKFDKDTQMIIPKDDTEKANNDFQTLNMIKALIMLEPDYTREEFLKVNKGAPKLFEILSKKGIVTLPPKIEDMGILNILDRLDELEELKPTTDATNATPAAAAAAAAAAATNAATAGSTSVKAEDSDLLKDVTGSLEK